MVFKFFLLALLATLSAAQWYGTGYAGGYNNYYLVPGGYGVDGMGYGGLGGYGYGGYGGGYGGLGGYGGYGGGYGGLGGYGGYGGGYY